MIITTIGDIHGHDSWKKLIEENKDTDKFVFLGDYVDSFSVPDSTVIENLLDILKYKEDNPDKVILLLGNHDYHYITNDRECHYSGFRRSISDRLHNILHKAYFEDKLIKLIHEEGKYIFSHAGITNCWLQTVSNVHEVSELNDVNKLDFDTLDWNSYTGISWSGNTISQSPIWVRPYSLEKDMYDKGDTVQIVGHTCVYDLSNYDNKIYVCDCMHCGQYLQIDDNKEIVKNFKHND